MQVPVTAETIHLLDDGAAGAAINAALKQMIRDTDDRGADGKVRKTVITLESIKVSDRDVAVTCEVGTTTPKYRTGGTIARLNVVGNTAELNFNAMAPDAPDQRTIDEVLDAQEKNNRKPKNEEE